MAGGPAFAHFPKGSEIADQDGRFCRTLFFTSRPPWTMATTCRGGGSPAGHSFTLGVQSRFMTIELGVSPRVLMALFDTSQVSPGISREIPGVGTLKLGIMMEKRDFPPMQANAFVPIVLTISTTVLSGVVVRLLADFLAAKIKGADKARRMMTINKKLVEVTTPEAILIVLTEEIKIEE